MLGKAKSNKLRIILGLIYLLISFCLLSLNFYYPKSSLNISYFINKSAFSSLSFFSSLPQTYTKYTNSLQYIKELEKDNIALKQQLHNLNSIYIKNSILAQENIELQQLLKVAKKSAFNFNKIITAKLFAKNLSSTSDVFIINNGSNSGISDNLIVVANNALVGRTIDTNKNYTKVLLLTNNKSRIPVYSKQSNINAIIVGNNSDTPSVIYYDKSHNFIEGEVILTSGLGGIFPRNIPVGTIYKDKNTWLLKTFNNFNNVYYVHIITTKYKIKN